MKSPRKLSANEIPAYGVELISVLQKLRETGCSVESIERQLGTNAGWIVRWFKAKTVERPMKQGEMFGVV